jgi:hypothetical protein
LPSVWSHCCPLYPCPRHCCLGMLDSPDPVERVCLLRPVLYTLLNYSTKERMKRAPGYPVPGPASSLVNLLYCVLHCREIYIVFYSVLFSSILNCGTFGKIGQSLRIHYRCESITRIMVANSKLLPAFWLLM